MFQRFIGSCFVLILCSAPVFSQDAPAWLTQAAAARPPAYAPDVPAVTLFREQHVTVNGEGRVTIVERGAMRVLTAEGRRMADCAAVYMTDGGRVREMRAWLIPPQGNVRRYGRDQSADQAIALNDVYNEARVRVIDAEDEAVIGSVFGYEWTTEERMLFAQSDWEFQKRLPQVRYSAALPTLVSRYTVTLPANWRAESVTFNHARIEPSVTGTTYVWELSNLPPIEPEPSSPPVTNLAPRLAVSYVPPTTGARAGVGAFGNWADVSRWMTQLSEPQAVANDALAARARELTANARTELEKIAGIARYVQNIQYISIQTGMGRGGGYRPHAATEVFSRSYGDCKDKANLMRAMLRSIGISSYLVGIYSGDPTYVREEWPSPQQFNHCIIAVRVSDDTQAPTIITHPSLGRLLIFDATDDITPIGDLPDHEQGSLALICAGEGGALLRMPTTPAEANRLERHAEVQLTADGTITARVREQASGQTAVEFRREFRRLSRPEYSGIIEAWIARGVTGASVSRIEPTDNTSENRFTLEMEFTAPRYGQTMQRLILFKPAIVSRRDSLFLTAASRRHPVMLEANAYTETVRIRLPEAFEVDELPDPVRLDTPFGSYATTYEVREGHLIFTRALTVRAATIPAEAYAAVRSFFERVRSAEQSPVVLARR